MSPGEARGGSLVSTQCGESNNLATPILLLIALAIHSLFEGMVMGIQASEKNTTSIFLAILFHKPIEGLTLGSLMVKENVANIHYAVLMVILALISPLGVLIGLGSSSSDL
jgi:zinc transporter 1/2/3